MENTTDFNQKDSIEMLTKREYFSIKIMAAAISNPIIKERNLKHIAKESISAADALIRELENIKK